MDDTELETDTKKSRLFLEKSDDIDSEILVSRFCFIESNRAVIDQVDGLVGHVYCTVTVQFSLGW